MSVYRLLVVDDDSTQRAVVAEYLTLSGFDVQQADHGQRALQLMSENEPDLVVLDVQMPDMDGLELLERIKSQGKWRDIPIILLSNLSRAHLKVRGLELGADDFVVKSAQPTELVARVRAGLRRASRYRKLEGAAVGDLRDFGLDGVLQTLQIGRKTASVELADLGGRIDVVAGAVSSCKFRRFEGSHALTRMFLLARGRFVIHFGEARAQEPSSPSADTASIMEALVAVDEAHQALGDLLQRHPLVGLAPGCGDPIFQALRSLFPMPLIELVAALEGSIQHNAQIISSAFASGKLVEAT